MQRLSADEAMLLGDIRDRRNEWGLAARAYAAVLAVAPADRMAAYRLVTAAIDAGEEAVALRVLRSSLLPALDDLDERQLRGVMRTASALGEHAAALQVFELAQARFPGSLSAAVRQRLETALQNQAAPIQPLISLGENCLPWLLPNRWGLRAAPAGGGHTPFDLGQTSTERCADILDSRFEALIDRFLAQCAVDRPVFLHYSEYPGDLSRLVHVMQDFRAGRDFRLLIVDVLPGRPLPAGTDQVHCLKVALPRQDYRWYGPDDFDSAEGVAWEYALQNFIRNASR